jgi:hypothetical protein
MKNTYLKISVGLLLVTLNSIAQETTSIITNATWKVSTNVNSNWAENGFDDNNWAFASQSPDSAGTMSLQWGWGNTFNSRARNIWIAGSSPSYFRKKFEVLIDTALIDSADFRTAIDDDFELYINGSIAQLDGDCQSSVKVVNVKSKLIQGANVIAIKGIDCGGLSFLLGELRIVRQSTTSTQNSFEAGSKIKIYPNPVSRYISIENPHSINDQSLLVKIVNSLGQIATYSLLDEPISKIDLSDLPKSCIYTVQILNYEGKILKSTRIMTH